MIIVLTDTLKKKPVHLLKSQIFYWQTSDGFKGSASMVVSNSGAYVFVDETPAQIDAKILATSGPDKPVQPKTEPNT